MLGSLFQGSDLPQIASVGKIYSTLYKVDISLQMSKKETVDSDPAYGTV